jgi:hypothetical protein
LVKNVPLRASSCSTLPAIITETAASTRPAARATPWTPVATATIALGPPRIRQDMPISAAPMLRPIAIASNSAQVQSTPMPEL